MALFHMHCKVIQRSKGKSAVAAAAYRSGSSIESDYDGTTYSYIKKAGVVASEIVAPEGSPLWITDRSKLWNAVEAIEKRKDAQLAREIELALPLELDAKAKQDLAREFVISEFVNHGMVADMNYHDKDGTNPHVHIMLTTRELTPDGFGKKNREWNSKDLLLDWRKKWEEKLNLALKKAGIEEQVCCESYTAQEIDREPQIHIGVHAAAMEARGIETERGDINRGIVARNAKKEIAQILDLEQKARIKTAESSRILADIEAVDETQSAAQKWKAEQIQRLKAERAEETTKTRKADKSKDEMEKRHKAERDELYGVPWDERGKEWDVNKMVLQSQQLKETLEMEQMLEQARERAADEASKPKAGVAGQSLPTPRQRESVKKTVADRHDMGASQERPSNGQISEIGTPRPESELSDEVPVPLVSATETATSERRPSVSDEATAAAKVASSTAEPGEILEPKAAVKVPLVVLPERKRPSPAVANATPTDGEAKKGLTSEPKPKAAVESAPMTTSPERSNGQNTPRSKPELSDRENRIQAIARMVAEEQKELHQKFDAVYAKVKELKAAEPKGLLEILRESKEHKEWQEEIAQAVEAQNRAWEACGGDLTAPDQGKAEVKRRLTPEYALKTAEKQVEAEEREARREARIKEERRQAASRDTVELKVGSKAICHTLETLLESRTFPAEIIKTSSESIKVRTEGKELTLRREKCYFTEPEVPQVSAEYESIQKEARRRLAERAKKEQREQQSQDGDLGR